MIDTDKYEGHTPAPWTWRGETIDGDGKVNHTVCYMEHPHVNGKMNEVDAQLIADTPDLLAEFKRLREENKRLGQYHHPLYWLYDKERFGWEVSEEQWEIIGRLLGAVTDHNDNEWEDEEE